MAHCAVSLWQHIKMEKYVPKPKMIDVKFSGVALPISADNQSNWRNASPATSNGAGLSCELDYDISFCSWILSWKHPHFVELSTFCGYYPHFVEVSNFCGYYPHFVEISTFCGYYFHFVEISTFCGYHLNFVYIFVFSGDYLHFAEISTFRGYCLHFVRSIYQNLPI